MASQLTNPKQVELVAQLVREGLAKAPRVIQALNETDRGHYTEGAAGSYLDHPLGIGLNQTISAPHMHAMCLELLSPSLPEMDGLKVLDVGCGSGYLTAALARLVGEKGLVVGIDRLPALVDASRRHIEADFGRPLGEIPNLQLLYADGWQGHSSEAPYDAIHVGAAAESVPEQLVDQLKVGGRLIIPVGVDEQALLLLIKDPDGGLVRKLVCGVRYVPLVRGLASS